MSRDDLLIIIDRATAPKVMSKEDALDFLETLVDDLKARCEALRDEMADES